MKELLGFLERLLSLMDLSKYNQEFKDWILQKANADVADGVRREIKMLPNGFAICMDTVFNSSVFGMFEVADKLFLLYRCDGFVKKSQFEDQVKARELYNDVLEYLTRSAI